MIDATAAAPGPDVSWPTELVRRRLWSWLRRRYGRRLLAPVAAGLLALLAVLGLRAIDPGILVDARLGLFDAYQRAAPRPYQPLPVRVVDIDDRSLEKLGQWPWPRWQLARLIDRLSELGASVIVLDIVLSEPDRTSPRNLRASWRGEPALAALADQLEQLPDFDRQLADAMARSRVVTSFGLTDSGNPRQPLAKAGLAALGPDPSGFLSSFEGSVATLPVLEEAAAGNGSFSVVATAGSVIRRVPLLYAQGERVHPSLALEAVRVAQGANTIKVRSYDREQARASGREEGVAQLRVGQVDIPVNPDGQVWMHYTEAVPERTVPVWQLLDPGVPSRELRARIAGNIVLIGTSAVGLKDLRATPLNPFEAGVAVHAQLIEQLLLGWHLDRPAWVGGTEVGAAVLGGSLLIALLVIVGARWSGLLGIAAVASMFVASWIAYRDHLLLLDPTYPVLTFLAVYLSVTFMLFLRTEQEKGQLRSAFSQYLAPALVRQLVEHPERLKLGGEGREMTFLFTDLAGFTSFTEKADPEFLVEVLNAYLDGLCQIVMDHGGTVDKIVGDAVHALFNAPVDQPDHAPRAVACAMAMDAFALDFAAARRAKGTELGITRIGVNTGYAVVGNFGGRRRFDYTAHGDAINTAARLEGANKSLGTRICVAAGTAERCPGLPFRPIGTLILKGKVVGIDAVEPLTPEEAACARVADYLVAFDRLRAEAPDATLLFAELARRHPGDSLIAFHDRRLAAGAQGATITLVEK